MQTLATKTDHNIIAMIHMAWQQSWVQSTHSMILYFLVTLSSLRCAPHRTMKATRNSNGKRRFFFLSFYLASLPNDVHKTITITINKEKQKMKQQQHFLSLAHCGNWINIFKPTDPMMWYTFTSLWKWVTTTIAREDNPNF